MKVPQRLWAYGKFRYYKNAVLMLIKELRGASVDNNVTYCNYLFLRDPIAAHAANTFRPTAMNFR